MQVLSPIIKRIKLISQPNYILYIIFTTSLSFAVYINEKIFFSDIDDPPIANTSTVYYLKLPRFFTNGVREEIHAHPPIVNHLSFQWKISPSSHFSSSLRPVAAIYLVDPRVYHVVPYPRYP